jgi:hypothetical protein
VLRQGYVFVFDEARNKWQIYAVNPQGYLFKVPSKPGKYTVLGAFNCSTEGHRQIASCISIPDPKYATRVWIGFSEVMWTQAVMNKHATEAYRNLHMIEINVTDILAGKDNLYTRPIAQVSAVVAEYAMKNDIAKSAFDHSPFPPDPRFGTAESLVEICEVMLPGKARIVTLSDPSAIAQELALKMNRNAYTFANHPSRRREVIADQTIDSIESGVRFRSDKMRVAAVKSVAQYQASFPHDRWSQQRMERKEPPAIPVTTESELKRAANEDWAKYAKKFNTADRKKWKDNYLKQLEAFDEKFISPLARNHVSWMQSSSLQNYFRCNFDNRDAGSGVAYTHTFNKCIVATEDKLACARLYDSWLQGSPGDKHNLLMRALVTNMEAVAREVHKVAVGDFDIRQIPWDNILSIHKESLGRLQSAAGDVAAKTVVNVLGCIGRALGMLLNAYVTVPYSIDGKTKSAKSLLMGLGVISGKAIVPCKLVGSHADFVYYLSKKLGIISGVTIADDVMEDAVRKVIHNKGITAQRIDGNDVWLAMPDKTIPPAPSHLTLPSEQADWISSYVNTVDEVENLDMNKWKALTNTNMRFSVVAAALQLACLTKMAGDQKKALGNEKGEATIRLYTSLLAFGGTTADIIGNVLAGRSAFSLGTALASEMNIFLRVGKGAGVAAGVAMAICDGYHGYVEYKSGADGIVIVSYGASALVGFTLSMVLFYCTGALLIPLVGILVLLLVGIGLWIESIKDNPVQDWLERCPWGNVVHERYKDLATEQAELVKALS